MKIIESKSKSKWNDFVSQAELGSFLESWEWGEIEQSEGQKIWRLALVNDSNKYVAVCLLIKQNLPLGLSYIYSPMGPVMALSNLQLKAGKVLMKKIFEISEQENAIFLRFEPKVEPHTKIPYGFVLGPQVQPRNTQILNLSLSQEELLKQMHPKTRYNIRLSERKGVKVRISEKSEKDFENFYKLIQATCDREKISAHSKIHYQKILEKFENNSAKLYLAEYNNQVLAVALNVFYGRKVVYCHGGSSSENRNLMAPYALQWYAICDAKNAGMTEYDFGGIAPEDASLNHSWQGITRFKKGFGGKSEHYLGSIDFPYKQGLYKLYLLRRKIKGRM